MSFAAKVKKKANNKNKDKQTPHTLLQKLSPKTTPPPLKDNYHGIPEKQKGAVYNTYQNIRSRVKTTSENEDWFEIQSGVR